MYVCHGGRLRDRDTVHISPRFAASTIKWRTAQGFCGPIAWRRLDVYASTFMLPRFPLYFDGFMF